MPTTGKKSIILGLILLLGMVVAVGQGAPAGAPPAKGKTIQKRGKVEAGVEGACLVVRDARDHKLYNVLFGEGEKPKAGEEISFSGTLHDGPTTCMEGIAVDVSSWKLLRAATPEPAPMPVMEL
jgi:hypothetical protein